jgi:hypothetical protein
MPMTIKSKIIDIIGAMFILFAAPFLRHARFRMHARPLIKAVLTKVGVFPVLDHYYEPMVVTDQLQNLSAVRNLPGIDFNLEAQKALMARLPSDAAIDVLFKEPSNEHAFVLKNGYFENGDADVWFRVIQHFKPARIIEIGSGHSTKVARLALACNEQETGGAHCEHICIDPNAPHYLDLLDVQVIRQKVETVDLSMFKKLGPGDILFIDSSHVIRPQGDVLFEYLQILPSLALGVIVHIHDIFTPREYPADWLQERRYLWNEQYLLEAFLTHNNCWEVLLASNMLMHEQFDLLKSKCPSLDRNKVPRSLYIRRK